MRLLHTRRRFLKAASVCGMELLGLWQMPAKADDLETRSVRLLREPGICDAPLYVAGELLKAEGFTEVRYVHIEPGNTDAAMVADGRLDFSQSYAPEAIRQIDVGKPLTVLAGVHPRCHELFAHEPINTIRDLRGRRVAAPDEIGYATRLMLVLMASSVGFDPAQAARVLVRGGLVERYDDAIQGLAVVPYVAWRDYDAEDTVRYFALRLYEAGLIHSTPRDIIARWTDWRFLNEIKPESKM